MYRDCNFNNGQMSTSGARNGVAVLIILQYVNLLLGIVSL